MKIIIVFSLLMSFVLADSSVAGPPVINKDGQGHIVQQTDATGHKSIHTYSREGNRIKSENDNGQRIFFDKSGKGNPNQTEEPIK